MLFGIKPRFGNARLLAGISDREDGRAGGFLVGCTTYTPVEGTDDEEYATTYLEYSGRSDHLANALASATGVELPTQLVSEAGDDVQYVGTPEMNSRFRTDRKEVTSTNAAPKATLEASAEVVA